MVMDEPWKCPWCGEDDPDTLGPPEDRRSIAAHERWLEEHVTECEPFKKEAGDGH